MSQGSGVARRIKIQLDGRGNGGIEVDGVPIPRTFAVRVDGEFGSVPRVSVDMYARDGSELDVLAELGVCVTHLTAGHDREYMDALGLVLVPRDTLKAELDRMGAMGIPPARELVAACEPTSSQAKEVGA